MGTEALTNLLTIFLAISIIILFVLVVVFVILYLKEKNQKKVKKKEKEIKQEKTPSNIVQTKMYTAENIKKFMDFTEIKDNMIIQKDGKRLVMVIKCQGINYDLMSSIERVGVEQGFTQFLNTLTKPIQLHIQARKVNLEDSIQRYKKRLNYIEANFNKVRMQYERAQSNPNITPAELKAIKLEYVRQKNLYEYTTDIISNTERMSLNQNVLTKNYYIAISYYPENQENLFQQEEILEIAFSEMYTRAQSILRTLAVCGVTGKVLDSVELAELLYVAYNRDSSEIYEVDKAIKAGYDALYTTAPDVINKKMEELNKIIAEKADNLVNETLDKVLFKTQQEKELEQKERDMDELIKEMAKSIILENQDYIPQDIAEKSIEEIDNIETKKIVNKRKTKKGA